MRPGARSVGVVLAILLASSIAVARPSRPSVLSGEVLWVVDGDTIKVRINGRVEKVRYIGVDTPEIRHPTRGGQPGGREASAVNRDLVAGKRVRLELDVQSKDRYGRLLAYVWVGDLMVNAELVRRGYAQVATVPPNVRYQELFLKLQRDARSLGGGLDGPLRSLPQDRIAPAKPALERPCL